VKPSEVIVGDAKDGVSAAPKFDEDDNVAEPLEYPERVVVMVAVEVVPGSTPDTVTRPLPLIVTDPPAVAVPAHVKSEL
jgi:hypothetical protein